MFQHPLRQQHSHHPVLYRFSVLLLPVCLTRTLELDYISCVNFPGDSIFYPFFYIFNIYPAFLTSLKYLSLNRLKNNPGDFETSI